MSTDKKPRKNTGHPAQPLQGPVDFKAMTRDIIARFPKVLARLAG